MRAAEQAISNPMLDHALKGARGLIISIVGGEDLRLMEVDEAAAFIKDMVDPEADIIWGSAFNNDLEGRIRVSVVATGIEAPFEAFNRLPAGLVGLVPAVAERLPLIGLVESIPTVAEIPPSAHELPTCDEPRPDPAAEPVFCGSEEPVSCGDGTQEELPLVQTDSGATARPYASLAVGAQTGGPGPEVRGPSLFERMAAAARGAVRAQIGSDLTSTSDDRRERQIA
jgi:cell division protein FtsZ